jgi:hypothetical protein
MRFLRSIKDGIKRAISSHPFGKIMQIRGDSEPLSASVVIAYTVRLIILTLLTAFIVWVSSIAGMEPSEFIDLIKKLSSVSNG